LPPKGVWRYWLVKAGRGWGKTRTGAEWVRDRVKQGATRIAVVGRTSADVRDVMVEGRSGLLAVFPPEQRPVYEPSKRRITFHTGAIATTYSADEPEMLRGPEHDTAWADELCAWRFPDAWDQLQFGLRVGDDPRAVITTTPKPSRLIKDLLNHPHCVVTHGSTFENKANVAKAWLDNILQKYEGTTLGMQELHAELLDEMPGALWSRQSLDGARCSSDSGSMQRIVVAIDPATTSKQTSDDTGMVVAGIDANGTGYLLEDLTCHVSPSQWAQIAVDAYHRWKADRVIAETNQGGDMVEATLRTIDRSIPYLGIHASRNKQARAEPVSALYEQGRIKHAGVFKDLEDELCSWVPNSNMPSPNRLDALVWAFTELMLNSRTAMISIDPGTNYRGDVWL
tara:strand:+ start:3444 stop:4634 length:1191 start_codon:yes stop_codon:yes gene_type:complete